MSLLTIFPDTQANQGETFRDYPLIKEKLAEIDVEFERWNASTVLAHDADQATVLAAYQKSIDKLNQRYNFQAVDVISLTPAHPDKETLRKKFLAEHTHEDFEVRFFIEGKGMFYLHVDDKVYALLCEAGDLISVPNQAPHWFDMGENPDFKCIRLFTVADGWVAEFTGSTISADFPNFDQYIAQYA